MPVTTTQPGGINSAGTSKPTENSSFRVGTWEDRNRKCRRTMEDTHSYLYNFLDVERPLSDCPVLRIPGAENTDSGYFAVFDGHAGSFAAEFCGKNLHKILADIIHSNPGTLIPELLDQAFMKTDHSLEKATQKSSSGCTAAIAMMRWEDRVPSEKSSLGTQSLLPAAVAAATAAANPSAKGLFKKKATSAPDADAIHQHEQQLKGLAIRQRILYTANVGDARIILCRDGKAQRLSYDHKGSDEVEARRISQSGGLILNNRVNGVLAVTRALGDHYIKELVTGHPYTTETVIKQGQDEFMIIACDGLWDVCSDQDAVDLVRQIKDPQDAAKTLVEHALSRFSTDNLSCMVVRFLDPARLGGGDGEKTKEGTTLGGATNANRTCCNGAGVNGEAASAAPCSGLTTSPPVTQSDVEFTPTALDEAVQEEASPIGEKQSKVNGKMKK